MKREILVAVAGLAAVAAGMTGCSHHKSEGSSTAKVVIDGQDQHVGGVVSCTKTGDTVTIVVGDKSSGNVAVVTEGDSPEVKSVTLANAEGKTVAYIPVQGSAKATKSGNRYTITGTGPTSDVNNLDDMSSKPFELDVTCP